MLQTAQYWKKIWEKDTTDNGNPQSLVELRAGHSNLPNRVIVTVADIQERDVSVYRNICGEYGLEVPRSKWETPQVVENDRT